MQYWNALHYLRDDVPALKSSQHISLRSEPSYLHPCDITCEPEASSPGLQASDWARRGASDAAAEASAAMGRHPAD